MPRICPLAKCLIVNPLPNTADAGVASEVDEVVSKVCVGVVNAVDEEVQEVQESRRQRVKLHVFRPPTRAVSRCKSGAIRG